MELFNYLLKSVAILSIFYMVYFAFLKKDTLFNAKRHFFIAGIISALLFPLVEFTQIVYMEQPPITVTSSLDMDSVIPSTAIKLDTPTTPIKSPFNWWWVAFGIYVIGLVVFLGRLSVQLLSLLRLLKKYPSIKKGRYRFVEIDQNFSPFSFFTYIVYNPSSHESEELEMILKHEKVHASQWHSVDIISIHILRAIQWINPFSWLYKKSMEENLEFLADLHTVSQLPSKKQYQLTLVKASSPVLAPALTTQFYQSFIKKRIIMLNTNSTKKHNLWKLSLVLPFLAFFLWSFNVTEEIHYATSTNELATIEKQAEFLVSTETSNDELNAIEDQLALQSTGLKVTFVDRLRNSDGNLTELSIDTQFPGQEGYYKNVTYGGASKEISSVKLKIVEEQLEFGSIGDDMILRATEKGVVALKFPKKEKEQKETLGENPLYVINGEEILKEDLPKDVNYEVSEAIVELDTEEALSKYGKKGTDGAVVFEGHTTIHKDETTSINTLNTEPTASQTEEIRPVLTAPMKELRISIDKNTTDAELEKLKKKAKADHDVDLSYTVVRNDNREIISISLSYSGNGNSGSYSVNDDDPIDEFFFFAKDNGDLGFWSEAHEARKKEREIEHEARMEEHQERMEEHRNRMAERRVEMEERKEEMEERKHEMEERKHEMKERMHERKKQIKQRQKEVKKMHTEHRTDTRTNGNYSYTRQGNNAANLVTIAKDTSNEELEALKKKMAAQDISFNYSKVRRNKKGEITGIKVVTDNGKGSKSSISTKTDDGEPIDALVLEM